ncbi:MAG: FumA C-terminus/TtdB family hydratase beta subunit [Planctomycetota bacterium]|nr:FumA C-terminus/TtdB family hydratase beta subunit [Planctomycetota bacterium]
MKHFSLPLTTESLKNLNAGDEVLLSGVMYTARDQAHLRLFNLLREKKPLPVDLRGQTIYYAGPTPAPLGRPIGAAGPTTSGRMDRFAPALLAAGLRGMVGKGERKKEVVDAIREHGAVYFIAIGGAGAYLSKRITKCEVVAFDDLGPESVKRLEVKDFPAIVGVDPRGRSVFLRKS